MTDNLSDHRFDRKLICIKYPGNVQNTEKMLETLGGLQNLSKTFSSRNRRLDLRFRPEDPHCKAVFGDKEIVSGLLLKVRVPRKKADDGAETMPQVSYTVLGKFLPQKFDANKQEVVSIAEEIFPVQHIPSLSWIEESSDQLFLLPAALSRMDNPNVFSHRPETYSIESNPTESNVLTKSRRKPRKFFTQKVVYSENMTVPTKPLPAALKEVKIKKIPPEFIEEIRRLFEARPIWSKAALETVAKPRNFSVLRYTLPSIAYYLQSGPWRLLWVRYGYDPRLDPSSRLYQIVDYRTQSLSLKTVMKARSRTNIRMLSTKSCHTRSARKGFITLEALQPTEVPEIDQENSYKFRVGMIPPHKNMLYQVCDLEVDEIQELAMNPLPPEVQCNERLGWFTADFFDTVRKIIDRYAIATASALYGDKILGTVTEESESSSDSDDSSLVILTNSSSEDELEREPEQGFEVDSDDD